MMHGKQKNHNFCMFPPNLPPKKKIWGQNQANDDDNDGDYYCFAEATYL